MVQELLESLSSDRCIVLSTHILDEAERIANRALILSQGRILVDSTPDELMSRATQHNDIEVVLDRDVPEDLVREVEAADGCAEARAEGRRLRVRPEAGARPLGAILSVVGRRADLAVEDVEVREGRLDDLFREITRGVAA